MPEDKASHFDTPHGDGWACCQRAGLELVEQVRSMDQKVIDLRTINTGRCNELNVERIAFKELHDSYTQLTKERDDFRDQLLTATNVNTTINAQRDRIDAKCESLHSRLAEASNRIAEMKDEAKECGKSQSHLGEADALIDSLREMNHKKAGEIVRLSNQSNDLHDKVMELQAERAAVQRFFGAFKDA